MFAGPASPGLRLVTGEPLTSANAPAPDAPPVANTVVAAVAEEIAALGEHHRPGLEAVALTLAAILDNPRATSSQPPAAGRLMQVMEQLHASTPKRRGKLSVVRAMTAERSGPSG